MLRHKYLLVVFFFFLGILIVIPKNAHAFTCTNDGTATVSVDLTLPDSNEMVLVSDMGTYTKCSGNVGQGTQNDALRTHSFSISDSLRNNGYTGYFQTPTATYPETTSSPVCVWPTEGVGSDCIDSLPSEYLTTPLSLKIHIQRNGITMKDGAILKAGTEIARISLDQRSSGKWGWTRTWIFVLKNDVQIPAHTCEVDASTPSTVMLNPTSESSLAHQSSTSEAKDFSIRLKCQGNVGVNLQLDGQADQNATDDGVLANISDLNPASGVGIQILYNSIPVKLRETFSTGVSTDGIYDIPMQARYYRTTPSPVVSGNVKAVMTYNLNYE